MKRRGFIATAIAGALALLTGKLPTSEDKPLEWRDFKPGNLRPNNVKIIYCEKNGLWYTIGGGLFAAYDDLDEAVGDAIDRGGPIDFYGRGIGDQLRFEDDQRETSTCTHS